MNKVLYNQSTVSDRLGKLSIAVWVAILVSIGIHARARPGDVPPTADWVIITQLLSCTFGGVFGIVLMRKYRQSGFGAKVFLAYLSVVAFSSILSPYSVTVLGYWVLLVGATLLTIGLVRRAQNVQDLIQLEKVWLMTTSAIVTTNVITSYLFIGVDPGYGDVYRLGMGWVHPSVLGYLASYVFCVSFIKKEFRHSIFLWALRLFLLLVIVASRTRIPLLICVLTLAIQVVRHLRWRNLYPWILISCFFLVVLSASTLAVSFNLPGATDSFEWFNRGDPSNLTTLTNRTEIWSSAIKIVMKDPLMILSGHGYGVSRLILSEETEGTPFFYSHCHNDFLEILFATGVVGLILYVTLVIYSTKWLTAFEQQRRYFSSGFAVRAATVMAAFYIASFFGVPVGGKVAPYTIIVIFYILALDKSRYFWRKVP